MRWCLPVLPLLAGCLFDPSGISTWAATDGSRDGAGSVTDGREDRHDLGALDLGLDQRPNTDGPAPAWLYRKRVTVDANMVTGSVTDFPLLVQVAADAELAAGARSDGRDIVFRALDGAALPREIERFEPATGALAAWVKVPALTSQSHTEIYLYYGNASPPAPPTTTSVWTNGYAGVWHLAGAAITDSGPAAHPATVKGTTSQVQGKIGEGRGFDTQPTTWIELGDPALASNAAFTIELWLHPNKSQASWIGLCTKGRATDSEWAGVWLKPDKLLTYGWGWKPPGAGNMDSTSTKPGAGAWHHVAATFDGTLARLYYNGLQDGASPKGQAYNLLAGPLILGTDVFENNPSFDGVLDEVRLSSVARSAGWIATQHANQSSPTAHVKVGPQESL